MRHARAIILQLGKMVVADPMVRAIHAATGSL